MALIAVAADKGSPGVTTTAVALAAIWPRPVLLAECDPAGGDLVYRLPGQDGQRLDPHRGLLSLAVAARRGPQIHQVWPHVQKLRGGLDVLTGVTSAEQGAGLDGLWGSVGAALAGLPEADVIADCGRLGPGGRFYDLLAQASAVVMVSKATLGDVVRLRERTAAVATAVRDRGGPGTGIGVIVVAGHKHFSAAIAEVSQALGTGGPAAVVGGLAWEPKSADLLRGEWGGKLDKSLLIRTARQIAGLLAAQLPAPASAAGRGSAGPMPPQPTAPARAAAPPRQPGLPGRIAAQQAHSAPPPQPAALAHSAVPPDYAAARPDHAAAPASHPAPSARLAALPAHSEPPSQAAAPAHPAAPPAHPAAPSAYALPPDHAAGSSAHPGPSARPTAMSAPPPAAPRLPAAPLQPVPAPGPVPAAAGAPPGRPLAAAHGSGGGPRPSQPPADRLVASSREITPTGVPPAGPLPAGIPSAGHPSAGSSPGGLPAAGSPPAGPAPAGPPPAGDPPGGGPAAPGYPGNTYPVTGHYPPGGPAPQHRTAAHSGNIPAGPVQFSGPAIAAHSGPAYQGFAAPPNGDMADHSDRDHAATKPRLSAGLAGNSAGQHTGNPAGYPGDPYAVTVPPGSGHPMAGYADAGWADAPGPHPAGPPHPAAPPAPEELRDLPRGRHSGAHPAHPAGEAG